MYLMDRAANRTKGANKVIERKRSSLNKGKFMTIVLSSKKSLLPIYRGRPRQRYLETAREIS